MISDCFERCPKHVVLVVCHLPHKANNSSSLIIYLSSASFKNRDGIVPFKYRDAIERMNQKVGEFVQNHHFDVHKETRVKRCASKKAPRFFFDAQRLTRVSLCTSKWWFCTNSPTFWFILSIAFSCFSPFQIWFAFWWHHVRDKPYELVHRTNQRPNVGNIFKSFRFYFRFRFAFHRYRTSIWQFKHNHSFFPLTPCIYSSLLPNQCHSNLAAFSSPPANGVPPNPLVAIRMSSKYTWTTSQMPHHRIPYP